MELLSFYLLEHGKNAPILLPTYEVCAQRGGGRSGRWNFVKQNIKGRQVQLGFSRACCS